MTITAIECRDADTIAYWLKRCDEKSEQNILDEKFIHDYATFIASSGSHFCYHVPDVAFLGFQVLSWPYRFDVAQAFAFVSESTSGLRVILETVKRLKVSTGIKHVAISGGNKRLMDLAVKYCFPDSKIRRTHGIIISEV